MHLILIVAAGCGLFFRGAPSAVCPACASGHCAPATQAAIAAIPPAPACAAPAACSPPAAAACGAACSPASEARAGNDVRLRPFARLRAGMAAGKHPLRPWLDR